MVHQRDVLIGCLSYVYKLDWLNVVKVVKQHNPTIIDPIQELEWWFLVQDIMNATSVIYLQFWV